MNNGHGGVTLWLTGLPCSGKTTIAEIVKRNLEGRGERVELLDGDAIRKHFSAGVGFSKEDRSNHLKRVSYLCHLLTRHGVVVLASFVSPYRENRDYARALIGERFVEIFVDTPLETCIKRDVKGMYKKALAGEIKEFTGISDPYEPPLKAELTLRTVGQTPQDGAQQVMDLLEHGADSVQRMR